MEDTNTKDTSCKFHALTPKDDEPLGIYQSAFEFVFTNDKVRNVAVSGAFGSGKSSILASCIDQYKNKKFKYISLAYFRPEEMGKADELSVSCDDDGTKDNDKTKSLSVETLLEGKILNQLIHQIPPEDIPRSNFRVKKERLEAKKLSGKAKVLICIGVILGLYTFLFSQWYALVDSMTVDWLQTPLTFSTHGEFRFFVGIVFLIIGGLFTYRFACHIIKAHNNRKIIKRANVKGLEIEIFEDSNESYFDKYLNEVLYLFDRSNADVIVFEDIDRYGSIKIFGRLREVNTLVNNNRKGKPPLRFFYLIKDDIFASKDRTKFFDFIIPIVPVIDSSNSYEQFIKHLKEGGLYENFDRSFLYRLSLYIDDMRILKNIHNELIMYMNRLKIVTDTKLSWNKMMAMIVYKNLFPRDFADLQLNRGFVFEVICERGRERLLASKRSKLETEIKNKQAQLNSAKVETLTEDELTVVYYLKHYKTIQQNWTPANGKQQLLLLKEQVLNQPSNHRNQNLVDILEEYEERIALAANNKKTHIARLEKEISLLNRELQNLTNKRVYELLTIENNDNFFRDTVFRSETKDENKTNSFDTIKDSPYFAMLKYFIREGFIDEMYSDYMTYFYPESISEIDKVFLRRVTEKRGAEFHYALKDPQKVIESPVLRPVDFEREETLNFDLFEYLLLNDNIPKYATYLKALVAQIKMTQNYDFVSKFYDRDKAIYQLVTQINKQWPGFFALVLQCSAMTDTQIRQYSINTLCFSDEDTIAKVNADNCLSEYISNITDYLAIENTTVDKLLTGFLLISVSFVSIDYETANKELFDGVYRNRLYALTFDNIALMLKKKYGVKSDSDIARKNYTLVQSCEDSPLANYVSKNMGTYTEILLANAEGGISDDESIAVKLLNHGDEEISVELKEQYIKLLSTAITKIEQVKDTKLWTTMMRQGKIAFSESNFIRYFQKYELDATLIKYLNDTTSAIDFTASVNTFGEEIAEKLFNAVIVNNHIATDKYKKMLVDLKCYFANYEADKIADDKFKILIAEEILQMNLESLDFVRQKYKSHLLSFIKQNLDQYISIQTEDNVNLNEVLQIITWDIGDDNKIMLLNLIDEPISIIDKKYSDAVNEHIINHNLSASDKPALYKRYLQYENKTRSKIASLAIADIIKIIDEKFLIDETLRSTLLQANTISRDQKITLFTIASPTLSEDARKAHLDELGLSDLNGIFTKSGGRRNYDISEDVTSILEAFKLHGLIYDFYVDDRNKSKYKVVKNKPRSKEPEILD